MPASTSQGSGRAPRKILMVAYPGVQPLDVVGPLEVFSAAQRLYMRDHPKRVPPYAIEVVGLTAGPMATPAGYSLYAERDYRTCRGPIDTLLIPGGEGARQRAEDAALLRWLTRAASRSRRVCSVCTGALILAAAGLLDGRRATTHWAACTYLARQHPDVLVEPDPIFIRDGRIYTSAGVLSGVDLALALVEDDLGSKLALEVARWLVVFLKRPGGQSQFSARIDPSAQPRRPFQALVAHMAEHPATDLSVTALAAHMGMSPRNFARRFQEELGVPPGSYATTLRVETARSRLEVGEESVDEVAAACGFGSAEVMRRAFLRHLHVSPSAYRERFWRGR